MPEFLRWRPILTVIPFDRTLQQSVCVLPLIFLLLSFGLPEMKETKPWTQIFNVFYVKYSCFEIRQYFLGKLISMLRYVRKKKLRTFFLLLFRGPFNPSPHRGWWIAISLAFLSSPKERPLKDDELLRWLWWFHTNSYKSYRTLARL